jgi:hypothetical protein
VQLKILSDNLWKTITETARKSKRNNVAVAYMGQGASKLLPLHKGDSLVVDMSEGAVKSGQTDPKEVEKFLRKGVNVYTCSNLHAKVYLFDKTLIVGSSNVSQHSKYDLIEVGLLSRDKDTLTQARGLIKSLQVEPITPEYIKLCKKLYNPPRIRYAKRKKGTTAPRHSRLWVTGVTSVEWSEKENELCETEERNASKKLKDARKFEINSIRWGGRSRFTEVAKEGDLIVQIWSDRNVKVWPPCRIVQITRYRSFDRWKRPRMFVHIEAPIHPKRLSWPVFRNTVVGAGYRNISQNSVCEIRSHEVAHAILGLWSD